jgi:hypothetical protein
MLNVLQSLRQSAKEIIKNAWSDDTNGGSSIRTGGARNKNLKLVKLT